MDEGRDDREHELLDDAASAAGRGPVPVRERDVLAGSVADEHAGAHPDGVHPVGGGGRCRARRLHLRGLAEWASNLDFPSEIRQEPEAFVTTCEGEGAQPPSGLVGMRTVVQPGPESGSGGSSRSSRCARGRRGDGTLRAELRACHEEATGTLPAEETGFGAGPGATVTTDVVGEQLRLIVS